jgi:hypothetical protein
MSAGRSAAAGAAWQQTPADAFPAVWGDWTRLNDKWSCRFSFVEGRLRWVWNAPKPPTKQQMLKIAAKFWQARHAFLVQLAARLDVEIVVFEREGTGGSRERP